jgi:hypothetical protein
MGFAPLIERNVKKREMPPAADQPATLFHTTELIRIGVIESFAVDLQHCRFKVFEAVAIHR